MATLCRAPTLGRPGGITPPSIGSWYSGPLLPPYDPTNPHRQRISGDVYLSPSPPEAGGEWRIDVGFTVADWKAGTPATQVRAAFPGTAVQIGGRWFEICRVGPFDQAPRRTAYDLWPWNDANVIRVAFDLTPKACEALTRKHNTLQRRTRQGSALAVLPLLTGLLPAQDQKRLEIETGQPAARSTMISAVVMLLLSAVTLSMTVALGLGTDFGELNALMRKIAAFWPLVGYLFLESLARMSSANGNEPMGSLPVCLPFYLVRSLGYINVPQEQIDARRAAAAPPSDLLAARDRVRTLNHSEYHLEVISRLPKDHWTVNVTGIEYQGEAYVLLERKILQTEDGPRHHFLLQKPDHEVLYKQYVRYQPEEVRDVYRGQQIAKTATWVETFPFLWGFTPGATQQRLARIYNYDPEKWTFRTIAGAAAFGVILLVGSAVAVVGGVGDGADALRFFLGLFLAWEAAVRWSKFRGGELPGSLLGVVLRPFASRVLRWE